VAGAKGGTGKSMIAANIGVFLATLGKEVVLVDAAFGGATLHSFLGVSEPSRTLADFFSNKEMQLEEALISTLVTNLRIVSGEKDPAWAANPRVHQLQRLRDQVRQLPVDYVIFDLSPGTRENILDLFLDADTGIVVSSAEPTAVEMSYRFIKAAFVRSLRRSELGFLGKMSVEEARECEGGIPAPSDLLRRALAKYEEDGEEVTALREHMAALMPYLVLNFARSKADMDLGRDIATAATRRFGIVIPYLGQVEYDDAVWVSLRRRRPLLIEHPESRASKCVEKLTRGLLAMESDKARAPELPGASLYDLLEVEPTASEESIRRANRRIGQIYAKDSVVIGGLYRPARLEKMQRQLEHAYDTLMNPAKRRLNDSALFPDGMPADSSPPLRRHDHRVALAVADLPPPPEVDENTVFSGKVLQDFREARGYELREIADRTKIGLSYLRAIEDERYGELPAMVYVRGFLAEYAKMLELDVPQVLETYLQRAGLSQGPDAEA
jgi:flagellar biosynthesis protein FlhG